MSDMEGKSALMVDKSIVVMVDEKKLLLARELLRHYTPRMSAKAQEEKAGGKTPSVRDYVENAFKKIGLEYTILPIDESLSILDSAS